MTWLRQTFPYLNDPLSTVVFWAAVVILLYVFFTWGIPLLTRKTKTEIDDVIIGILRLPIIIIIIAYAVLDIFRLYFPSAAWVDALHKVYLGIVIWVITWLLFHLIKDVVAKYLKDYAEESESSLDDVLVPLISKAGPIIVFIVALFITVGVFSPQLLGELLTVVGGLSFLLIFLFQEPLSNLFSGVYLWIDTPFKYKDLVFLEDGIFYRIEEIGTRVSKLYNTSAHTVAFFPNNKLAEQRLVNVTRPNVELRQGIDIGIAYKHSEDIGNIQSLLAEEANKHVHVLGPWDQPGESIRGKKELMEEEIKKARQKGEPDEVKFLENEMERLKIEYKMRADNQRSWEDITTLSALVGRMEDRGLEKRERVFIKHFLGEIKNNLLFMRRDLTVWVRWSGLLQASYKFKGDDFIELDFQDIEKSVVTVDEWKNLLERHPEDEQQIAWLQEGRKIPLIGEYRFNEEFSLSSVSALQLAYLLEKKLKDYPISEIQDLHLRSDKFQEADFQESLITVDTFQDYEFLLKSWSSAMRTLIRRIDRVDKMLERGGAGEFQIDAELKEIANFYSERFMLKVPGFRYPDADFQKFGESSVDFRLEFFVDDLVGEHFERLGDVVSDVGIWIKQQFDVKSIEIPFPQRDVRFKNLSQEFASSNKVLQPRSGRRKSKRSK